jgi:2-polyprenyl-3-methyl-5-hydroxy-6-metoxy-1,4-benzoquinol methylase
MKCKTCGLVVSPLIWQPQANESLEEEWFGQGYQSETSIWVKWFEALNNRQTLGRLAETRPPGRRLLEIGVGSGSFLYEAQEHGFVVTGCDLSRAICGRVERRYGITMFCGPLSEIKGNEKFDVIVMNHVLEHVNNPIFFLHDVIRLLTPGGVVHIAVPNVASWEAILPGWTSYEPYHLTYFTLDTLRKVVFASGLHIQKAQTNESFSGWFLAVLRTVLGVNHNCLGIEPNIRTNRVTDGRSRSILIEHAYRLAMVSIGGALLPIRIIQAKFGHGDEIVCIARASLTTSVR